MTLGILQKINLKADGADFFLNIPCVKRKEKGSIGGCAAAAAADIQRPPAIFSSRAESLTRSNATLNVLTNPF